MILWDSKKRGGRPDTMELLKATWASFGAEVIFITSNMQGNDEMMQGCREGMFICILIHSKSLTSENQLGYTHLAPFGTSDSPSSILTTVDRCITGAGFMNYVLDIYSIYNIRNGSYRIEASATLLLSHT
jgi:hypothetical protein